MYVNKIFYVICFQGISLGFDFQRASEFLEAARGIAFTAAQAARDRLIQYCTVHQQTDITIRVMNGGRPPNAAVEASCAGRIEIEDRFSLCNAHGTCLPTGTCVCNLERVAWLGTIIDFPFEIFYHPQVRLGKNSVFIGVCLST